MTIKYAPFDKVQSSNHTVISFFVILLYRTVLSKKKKSSSMFIFFMELDKRIRKAHDIALLLLLDLTTTT